MQVAPQDDVYSASEIARAAGVPERDVAALMDQRAHVAYAEALRIGRALATRGRLLFSQPAAPPGPVFARLAFSSTVHVGLIAAVVLVTSWVTVPLATTLATQEHVELPRLVFLVSPGPGGGGGGGGLLQ